MIAKTLRANMLTTLVQLRRLRPVDTAEEFLFPHFMRTWLRGAQEEEEDIHDAQAEDTVDESHFLDNIVVLLRRAEEEDIHDSQQEIESGGRSWPHHLYGSLEAYIARCNTSCMAIGAIIRSGSSRLLQWARNIPWSRWFLRRSEELPTTTINAAASDKPAVPVAAPSDSSGQWLSCCCQSFLFFKNCCISLFQWLVLAFELACTYRNWSYEVVGIKSYQENAMVSDVFLTAVSRRNLRKRIERVESTISEVRKSPLLVEESKSTLEYIANKNRSGIRTATKCKVFGQEVLRADIIARLCETPHDGAPNSSTSSCYSVVGIYGVAGSVKTTLARYNRDYIKEECKELFGTIMRIHVSETFSVDDIFHEMLKDITGDSRSDISDREELEEKLKESLCGKRFFLILDDLWVKNKNDPQLGELKSPLNVGMKGSKILVTARTKDAARALCDDEPIKMPELTEDEYLSMFMHYTLSDKCAADEAFVQVGRKIAKKLHGSPIAAAIVAGQLGTNPDICFWKNIANSDILNDTMDALWWSYQQLNPDIRRCFESCNVFPRRFEMSKDGLVHMWVAHGFVKTINGEDMEDMAECYFQELVSCSFMQAKVTRCNDDFFTIHDLLHDLLDKVSGSDYYRIENERRQKGENWKGDVPRDVRHLFVQNCGGELITKILQLENLHTLIIVDVEGYTLVEEKFFESICNRLLKLRVLAFCYIFGFYKLSVPESISQLKHLRYLVFRPMNFFGLWLETVILPSALIKLPNIQLLDFSGGKILGFNFAEHIKLRHIFCSPQLKLRNVGMLVSLQTIPGFTVSNEQGCELKQLRDLDKLRGSLEIHGLENVRSREEALEANLAAKERLTGLKLYWNGDDARCSPEVEAEVLEGLCPPVGLKTLHIYGYKGSRYPDWMEGKQIGGPEGLQVLTLYGWSQLGPAPELVVFPPLQAVYLVNCSWDALPGHMEHLTSLKFVDIGGCKNIQSLPTLPRSLEWFNLASCDVEFMRSSKTVGHPNWQMIQHINMSVVETPTPTRMTIIPLFPLFYHFGFVNITYVIDYLLLTLLMVLFTHLFASDQEDSDFDGISAEEL